MSEELATIKIIEQSIIAHDIKFELVMSFASDVLCALRHDV